MSERQPKPRKRVSTAVAQKSAAYRQLWRIVDGAVFDALYTHQDYLTEKGRVSARTSINKRVVGAVLSFAEQSAQGRVGRRAGDRQCCWAPGNPVPGTNLPANFPSAAFTTLRSVIIALYSQGGVAGGLLPAWRGSRLFQFFPALKASGSLLPCLSIAIQSLQKSFRCCSKAFHSVSSLLSSANQNGRRMRQSAVKERQE